MDKAEVYAYLDSRHIGYEVTEHETVYSMGELSSVALPYPGADAKNLFVRDDKKQSYYLITVKGDKRVDLKAFRQKNHTRPLSFAAPEDLLAILGLVPGSVSPFGLLHDGQGRVQFFLDRAFLQPPGVIGIHPNDNTATVWLKTQDLIALLEETGHTVNLTDA